MTRLMSILVIISAVVSTLFTVAGLVTSFMKGNHDVFIISIMAFISGWSICFLWEAIFTEEFIEVEIK